MSSTEPNVQNKGRVYYVDPYIDPNFIDGKSSYRDIPHPYEDYCIDLKLEVRVPRRDSFGQKSVTDTQ